jgi:carbonic anhydrase
MCEHSENHDGKRGLSRRNFASLALGAASLAAFPMAARGSEIEALCVCCIDYRLVDNAVHFFDVDQRLSHNFDLVALAGGSLAAVAPAFPSSGAAFWDHVAIAQQLHHIKRVVVLDHRDCGAYKVQFGSQFAGSGEPELEQHRGVMKLAKAEFERRKIALPVEYYLMGLNGKAERVV